MQTVTFPVATSQGPGRLLVDAGIDPHSILVLGHGAGGGTGSTDLELLASRLPERGTTVVRFEQPWRTAGRRVAGPPSQLDEAWVAAVGWLRDQKWGQGRLFAGGRSAGARVACRTALALGVRGVVCLAFPLHLPGRPEKSRAAELLTAGAPRLVLQGTSDSFGTPDEVRTAMGAAPGIRIVELPGADHGFRVGKNAPFTPAELRQRVLAEVTHFLAGYRE